MGRARKALRCDAGGAGPHGSLARLFLANNDVSRGPSGFSDLARIYVVDAKVDDSQSDSIQKQFSGHFATRSIFRSMTDPDAAE